MNLAIERTDFSQKSRVRLLEGPAGDIISIIIDLRSASDRADQEAADNEGGGPLQLWEDSDGSIILTVPTGFKGGELAVINLTTRVGVTYTRRLSDYHRSLKPAPPIVLRWG